MIGSETVNRKWVKYEFEKDWNDGKAVLGVCVHNLNCMKNGRCTQGLNPFDYTYSSNGTKFSAFVRTYNPNSFDAYNDITRNLETWIENAIVSR